MYVLVALCVLSWTSAAQAGVTPEPDFHVSFINMETMPDGFKDDDNGIDFDINSDGDHQVHTAQNGARYLEFDKETYYTASNDSVPHSCCSDVDDCTNGFTLMAWARGSRPWDNGDDVKQWFVSLGHGVDKMFGLQIGIRRMKFIAHVQGTTDWKRVECKVDSVVNSSESWNHYSVKRRNSPGAELFIHVNGEQFRVGHSNPNRTCTQNSYTPQNPVTEKSKQLVVGAAWDTDNDDFTGMFKGDISDIRMYYDNINITYIRDVWRAGPLVAPPASE